MVFARWRQCASAKCNDAGVGDAHLLRWLRGLIQILILGTRAEIIFFFGLVLREAGDPRAVDHHDQRYAEVDAHRVAVYRRQNAHQCHHQPARRKLCAPVWNPFARCNRLSNRLDNRLNACLHDAAGYTTGCSTSLTTGCIVYTSIQPVVIPVEQPAALCKQTFNQLNNRMNVCLHDAAGCRTGLTTSWTTGAVSCI